MFIESLEKEVKLLKRHIDILLAIKENQPIGIIKLADMLSLPQYKVRYSLRILEKDGMIIPTPNGAMLPQKAVKFLKELKTTLSKLTDDLEKLNKRLDDNNEA